MTFLLATNKKNIKKNALFLAAYLKISPLQSRGGFFGGTAPKPPLVGAAFWGASPPDPPPQQLYLYSRIYLCYPWKTLYKYNGE